MVAAASAAAVVAESLASGIHMKSIKGLGAVNHLSIVLEGEECSVLRAHETRQRMLNKLRVLTASTNCDFSSSNKAHADEPHLH